MTEVEPSAAARRIAQLEQRIAFQHALDACIEDVAQQRLSLPDAVHAALPLVREALEADVVWLETHAQGAPAERFAVGRHDVETVADELAERARGAVLNDAPDAAQLPDGEGLLYAQRLDVAGATFGTIAAQVHTAAPTAQGSLVRSCDWICSC